MSVKPKAEVGQRWLEKRMYPDESKGTVWEIVKIVSPDYCNMRVVSSDTSWQNKTGYVYEHWHINGFYRASWDFVGGGADTYRTCDCAGCGGKFVLAPGQEYQDRCDDCR